MPVLSKTMKYLHSIRPKTLPVHQPPGTSLNSLPILLFPYSRKHRGDSERAICLSPKSAILYRHRNFGSPKLRLWQMSYRSCSQWPVEEGGSLKYLSQVASSLPTVVHDPWRVVVRDWLFCRGGVLTIKTIS